MALRHRAFVIAFFLFVTLSAVSVRAQLGFGENLTISTAPRYPAPSETVMLSVESLLLDLETSDIAWYVDGVRSASGRGLLETTATMGELGSVMHVRAVVSQGGIEIVTAEIVIRPTAMDLLWEADSFAPPFFRGRSLAAPGTNLRMEAISYFMRANGSLIPAEEITFTWRKNGYVLADASGRGKSKAYLPSPPLFGTDTISVEAQTDNGTFASDARVTIPSVEPILSLYENHPLFGIIYHRALEAENILPEVETSFAAVPYYASANNANDRALTYEWRVDGNAIESDPVSPSEITVNAERSAGVARIELSLTHATNLFLNALGAWRVTLGAEGASGNPFFGETP